MAKSELGKMIKSVPEYVKTHWKTPGKGEYLSLREIGAYCVSQSGVFVFGTVQGIMSFSASYFCGAIMGIAAMDFYIISIIGTVLGYLLMFMNPLGVLLYENHGRLTKNMKIFANVCYLGQIIVGLSLYFVPSQQFEFIMKGFPQILGNILFIGGLFSYVNWFVRRKFSAKYGRLKPMILACGVPAAVLMSIIPFLPVQNLNYTLKLVILHFAFTFTNNFVGNFTNVAGMATFMTPSSQERQRLFSIVPIITGLTPSVIGIFFPMLIASTGGYLNLTTYKVFVPIFCFVGLVMTYFVAACKERIIEPPIEKREKVTFSRGAKYVLRDKYLWMLKISNLFRSVAVACKFTARLVVYLFASNGVVFGHCGEYRRTRYDLRKSSDSRAHQEI